MLDGGCRERLEGLRLGLMLGASCKRENYTLIIRLIEMKQESLLTISVLVAVGSR